MSQSPRPEVVCALKAVAREVGPESLAGRYGASYRPRVGTPGLYVIGGGGMRDLLVCLRYTEDRTLAPVRQAFAASSITLAVPSRVGGNDDARAWAEQLLSVLAPAELDALCDLLDRIRTGSSRGGRGEARRYTMATRSSSETCTREPLGAVERRFLASHFAQLARTARRGISVSRIAEKLIDLALWRWTTDAMTNGKVCYDNHKYCLDHLPHTAAVFDVWLANGRKRKSRDVLRHEHVVPRKALVPMVVGARDEDEIISLLDRYCIPCVVTADEHADLPEWPAGGGEPWCRYAGVAVIHSGASWWTRR